MTKTDFINSLDFEVAKGSIARKLGMKADDLVIKSSKSGDFRINLKTSSSKIGSLFSGPGRAFLITDNVNIKEYKNDTFSYEANIDLNLKNRSGEYRTRIGKINLNNDRFVFSTLNDIKNKNSKKREVNKNKANAS